VKPTTFHAFVLGAVLLYTATIIAYEFALADAKQQLPPALSFVERETEPETIPEPVVVKTSVMERTPVLDEEKAALEAENAALRARLDQLQFAMKPASVAQLAVLLKVEEQDVRWRVDRSALFKNASLLADSIRMVGAEKVWEALELEVEMRSELGHFKANNPAPTEGPKDAWYHNVWRPKVDHLLAKAINQLYAIGLPPAVVEAFRNRHSGS